MIRAITFAVALSLPRVPTHVACIGDSITAGYGATSEAHGWPAQLGLLLGPGVTVAAFGAPSATAGSYGPDPYTASQPYLDAGAWITAAGPDSVVDVAVLLGTNDSVSASFDAEAFAADYEALVQHFESLTPSPRVIVVVPPSTFWNTLIVDVEAPLLGVIAAGPGRMLVELPSSFSGAPWLLTSDGVHPNDGGHALIARVVWDAMKDAQLWTPDAITASSRRLMRSLGRTATGALRRSTYTPRQSP